MTKEACPAYFESQLYQLTRAPVSRSKYNSSQGAERDLMPSMSHNSPRLERKVPLDNLDEDIDYFDDI